MPDQPAPLTAEEIAECRASQYRWTGEMVNRLLATLDAKDAEIAALQTNEPSKIYEQTRDSAKAEAYRECVEILERSGEPQAIWAITKAHPEAFGEH